MQLAFEMSGYVIFPPLFITIHVPKTSGAGVWITTFDGSISDLSKSGFIVKRSV